jgi:hypothetical protein
MYAIYHHMRRIFTKRRRLTVYLDEDEYERIEQAAGGSGRISEYAREVLLEELGQARTSDGAGGETPVTASKRPARERTLRVRSANLVPAPSVANTCEHGATAYRCKKWGCKFYEIPNGRR